MACLKEGKLNSTKYSDPDGVETLSEINPRRDPADSENRDCLRVERTPAHRRPPEVPLSFSLDFCRRDYDFRWLEEKLAPLGFHLIFCYRAAASFEAARRERMKVSGNPSQYDDLGRFLREQEIMQSLVEESLLPKKTLDVSENDVAAAADAIADWLEATGGLHAQ